MSGVMAGGQIDKDSVYTLEEFRRRTGMGQFAYKTAKNQGLRIVRTAGRVFVRGADFYDYLDRISCEAEGEG